MKLDQLQEAQNLYFQTDLTKSEIAQQLGVSRRTIQYWVAQYDWARQKKNAEQMPTFLAENCYHIISNLQNNILSEDRVGQPVTLPEVNMLYRLTLTVNKLKTRATLNENMEAFLRFSENIEAENPGLAEQIAPYINKYIAAEAAHNHTKYWPKKLNSIGHIPAKDPSIQEKETALDIEGYMALVEQYQKQKQENTQPTNEQAAASPAPATKANAAKQDSATPYATSPSPRDRDGVRPLSPSLSFGEGWGEVSRACNTIATISP
jgi:Putative ATPase subunit of terminase (gpP-like)